MNYKPDVLIYHDNCDDGFAAAYIAHKKWGDALEYVPTNYGRPIPEFKGSEVLVADFSFSPDDTKAIVDRGSRILMLDHHKTAKHDLENMPAATRPTIDGVGKLFDRCTGDWTDSVLVEFDMNRSGAKMLWDFAFPGDETPELILAVEDRDLWRFSRPDTRLISLYLRSLDREFNQWDAAAALYSDNPEQFLAEANAIKRFNDQRVKSICESAGRQNFQGFNDVPVTYACPYDFVSEVCNTLLQMHPAAPFAVAVVQTHDGITYSMRSEDSREDVSEIAKANGGGGHRNAAGFRVSTK